jgi:hypothetical protein
MGLETGLTGTAELDVADADTAIALRSGDVPTLGTPRLIALCEEATLRALNGHGRTPPADGTRAAGERVSGPRSVRSERDPERSAGTRPRATYAASANRVTSTTPANVRS